MIHRVRIDGDGYYFYTYLDDAEIIEFLEYIISWALSES
jgi:hypothetical protein